jgi:hypothetical protein
MNQPKGSGGPVASRQIKRQGLEARKAAREKIISTIRGGSVTDRRRYLLPSCRVAEFALPTVGEYMRLREQAVLLATREQGDRATGMDLIYHVKEAALRRMMVGLTNVPVPVVMRPGWDEEAARKRAAEAVDAMARDAVSQDESISESMVETAVQARVVQLVDSGAVERDLFRQRLDFEDVPATLAMANVQSIDETDFDNHDHYLRQIQNSAVGSTEADDWEAVHGITAQMIEELYALSQGATFGNPKDGSETGKPKLKRPFRS